MVEWYINRIKNGKMTIEQIPAKWRDEVKSRIDAK